MGFFLADLKAYPPPVWARFKVSDQFAYCPGGAVEVVLAIEVLYIVESRDEACDLIRYILSF